MTRLLEVWQTAGPHQIESGGSIQPSTLAVIVGYGPVGRTVDELLRKDGLRTVVVDLNMDTIQKLTSEGRAAIYGDAFNIEVMHRRCPRPRTSSSRCPTPPTAAR